MKIVTLDIETSPNIAHVWGLFKQTVSLSQLRESTRVIAFAAKWYDKPDVLFHSDHHDGHEAMVRSAHALLNQADVLVHYNGKRFDVPHLQREFVLGELGPPAPFQQVDLLDVMRSRFRFASNKLQHVATELGIGSKTQHEGHELWVKCMAGDSAAWELMKKYNMQDVVLTEELYERVRPWITGHPHWGLFLDDDHCCSNCGGQNLTKQGFSHTKLSKFQQYRCSDCGTWSRGKTAVARVDERGVA